MAAIVQTARAQTDSGHRECGPEGWDLTEMLATMRIWFEVEGFDEAGILAWRVAEDSRPLYVESAIVAARSGETWFLSNLYRHPRSRRDGWETAVIYDAPNHVPARSYGSPPSATQIHQFRVESEWEGGSGGSFEVLDAGECPVWWENDP